MRTAGIVGAGLIGCSWAHVFARAGWRVLVWDPQDAQRLYVAQSGVDAVVMSTDQGASFTPFANGLANAGNPAELALSRAGTPLLYLAGTHGSFVTAREGSIEDTIFADGFD